MSIAEKYARGSTSKHLEMKVHEPGDLDVVIAAGMAKSVGTILLRCQREWDVARSRFEQLEADADRRNAAADAEARTTSCGPTRENLIRPDPADAFRTRAIIMVDMQSLSAAGVALKRHASSWAARRGLTLDRQQIARCVGLALDMWLDRRCDACCGRGHNGGYGLPVLGCRPCRGSGIWRRNLAVDTPQEYELASWLIGEADLLVSEAERSMKAKLP